MNWLHRHSFLFAYLVAAILAAPTRADAPVWKAGTARVRITPREPMWMSGYTARSRPAEGTLLDLWAKALVLQDPRGRRVALVTMDLVGVDRDLSLRIRTEVERKYHLPRAAIMLAVSHTHSGPVVGRNLAPMYGLDPVQQKRVDAYAAELQRNVVRLVGQAMEHLAPAELSWGTGKVTFAVNRRNNVESQVPALRERGLLRGPVDHDVPVLAVRDPDGTLRAIVFGYACHATVLNSYSWCSDYPGYAQFMVELVHPGTMALFWASCGGDQNPLPRRLVALAKRYGQDLANGVDSVLDAPMNRIRGNLVITYREIPLPFGKLPSRAQIEKDATSTNQYVARRAHLLLAEIQRHGSLPTIYPYPVQAWQLGTELTWVALGGEAVVDYSLRLKKELGRDHTWVTAYANDVMAYIPSARVLREGGYEGGGAMLYYGLPAPWGEDVEKTIVNAVHAAVRQVRASIRTNQPTGTP